MQVHSSSYPNTKARAMENASKQTRGLIFVSSFQQWINAFISVLIINYCKATIWFKRDNFPLLTDFRSRIFSSISDCFHSQVLVTHFRSRIFSIISDCFILRSQCGIDRVCCTILLTLRRRSQFINHKMQNFSKIKQFYQIIYFASQHICIYNIYYYFLDFYNYLTTMWINVSNVIFSWFFLLDPLDQHEVFCTISFRFCRFWRFHKFSVGVQWALEVWKVER